jgi:cytochrome P450
MMWEMARQPVWQERLRDEVRDLDEAALSFEGSKGLTQVDWVFKEANRLVPPVPFSPRVAVADTEVDGWRVPADAGITVASMLIHRDPDWWTNPHDFDPERFSDERAEHKQHSHVYVPFAGGAHTCLGNHFAQLMAKAILTQVLPRYRFSPGGGTRVEFQTVPIPKPRRNLPLEVSAA